MNGKITEAMILEWKRKAMHYDELSDGTGTIAFTQAELEAYVQLKISVALKASDGAKVEP